MSIVGNLGSEIRVTLGRAGSEAEVMREILQAQEIVIHKLIADVERLRSVLDDQLCGGLVKGLADVEASLSDDVVDRVGQLADGVTEVRRDIGGAVSTIHRMRRGTVTLVERVINYLEGCDHDHPITCAKYKADINAMKDAKESAWQIYDLIGYETDIRSREDHIVDRKEMKV